MRTQQAPTRLAVGLISSAAAVALLAPAASGATSQGVVAAAHPGPTAVAAATPVASTSVRPFLVIPTAPVGTAGPAAPAPVVLEVVRMPRTAASKKHKAMKTRLAKNQVAHKVAERTGYANELEWGLRGAAAGASQAAGQGALYGAVIGGLIGGVGGGILGGLAGTAGGAAAAAAITAASAGAGLIVAAPVATVILIAAAVAGVVIGAGIGAGIGGAIGAGIGAVNGAIPGYHEGVGNARYHNYRVRKNRGKPVSAAAVYREDPTLDSLSRSFKSQMPKALAGITLPKGGDKAADKAFEDAKRALAQALGIPVPKQR